MLTKLGFGPTEAELREIETLGEEKWLARQLAPGSDDGCDARIDATTRSPLGVRDVAVQLDRAVPDEI